MSAPIKRQHYEYSCREYLIPQINIIQPDLVLCLGSSVFQSIVSFSGEKIQKFADSVDKTFVLSGSLVKAVYHPGGHGTKNAGGKAAAMRCWKNAHTALLNHAVDHGKE